MFNFWIGVQSQIVSRCTRDCVAVEDSLSSVNHDRLRNEFYILERPCSSNCRNRAIRLPVFRSLISAKATDELYENNPISINDLTTNIMLHVDCPKTKSKKNKTYCSCFLSLWDTNDGVLKTLVNPNMSFSYAFSYFPSKHEEWSR